MSDLIRRSDAIEAIEVVDWYHQNRNKDMVSGANSDEHQAWYKADDVYKALKEVPSADRPRGEWIADEYGGCRCSVCGVREERFVYGLGEYWHGRGESNFCPNCGVRMKGADDE